MRFRDAVRQEELREPNRSGFRLDQWRAAVSELSEDEVDRNLGAAGEWIFERLESVRSALRFVTAKDIDAQTKLRALVAFSNANALTLQQKMAPMIKPQGDGTPFMVNKLLQIKLPLPGG